MVKLFKWIVSPFMDKRFNLSSMRIILLLMGYSVWRMMEEVCHYIHEAALTSTLIDWVGISAFLGAIATLVGVVVYGKVKQTKIESDEKNDSPS